MLLITVPQLSDYSKLLITASCQLNQHQGYASSHFCPGYSDAKVTPYDGEKKKKLYEMAKVFCSHCDSDDAVCNQLFCLPAVLIVNITQTMLQSMCEDIKTEFPACHSEFCTSSVTKRRARRSSPSIFNSPFTCRATFVWSMYAGMDDWCRVTCVNGYDGTCTEDYCVCSEAATTTTPPTATTLPTNGDQLGICTAWEANSVYSGTAGMHDWCQIMCSGGQCPQSHCQCRERLVVTAPTDIPTTTPTPSTTSSPTTMSTSSASQPASPPSTIPSSPTTSVSAEPPNESGTISSSLPTTTSPPTTMSAEPTTTSEQSSTTSASPPSIPSTSTDKSITTSTSTSTTSTGSQPSTMSTSTASTNGEPKATSTSPITTRSPLSTTSQQITTSSIPSSETTTSPPTTTTTKTSSVSSSEITSIPEISTAEGSTTTETKTSTLSSSSSQTGSESSMSTTISVLSTSPSSDPMTKSSSSSPEMSEATEPEEPTTFSVKSTESTPSRSTSPTTVSSPQSTTVSASSPVDFDVTDADSFHIVDQIVCDHARVQGHNTITTRFCQRNTEGVMEKSGYSDDVIDQVLGFAPKLLCSMTSGSARTDTCTNLFCGESPLSRRVIRSTLCAVCQSFGIDGSSPCLSAHC